MSYGTTVVCAVDNAVDAAHTGSGTNTGAARERRKEPPVFRLMAMVHALPNVTHRQRWVLKMAQELGTHRRWWEEKLGAQVDDPRAGAGLASAARRAFLGVGGTLTPPGWACDPAVPTHPGVLKHRLHDVRSSLARRFRHWARRQQRTAEEMAEGGGTDAGRRHQRGARRTTTAARSAT